MMTRQVTFPWCTCSGQYHQMVLIGLRIHFSITGTGGSDVCDTSIIKLIAEEELCSGDCKV
jgi:hypothetical protein